MGEIEGISEVKVFSQLMDRILSLPVKEGEAVKKGQILAVVRSSTLSESVKQAAAGLDVVVAQLEALRDQQKRLVELEKSGAVSSAQVISVNSQVAAAEAQYRQLDATLRQARKHYGDSVVRAPMSGIIGQLFLEAGDLASPQIPICSVVRLKRVLVKIRVPEIDLPDVRVGNRVEIELASRVGQKYTSQVSRVGPVIDRVSRTAIAEIELDNRAGIFKSGMLARVRIDVEDKQNVLLAPKSAFTVLPEFKSEKNLYRAVIVRQGKALERKVLLGLEQGGTVEILEGLYQGDQLVVSGQHLLEDGDPVRVVREEIETEKSTHETSGDGGLR
jgi:RND family efflux transporter MFP subunit